MPVTPTRQPRSTMFGSSGPRFGITIQYTSTTCITTMQMAPTASSGRRRLMFLDIKNQNGRKKLKTTSDRLVTFHVPPLSPQRWWNQDTSSGMFEYQVRKNWANEMYDQNTIHPKRSFPRSWKCSTFTASPRRVLRLSISVQRMSDAIWKRAHCAKNCTPKIVEYQVASRDSSQSNAKNVSVNAKMMSPAGAKFCDAAVFSRVLVLSCSVDHWK